MSFHECFWLADYQLGVNAVFEQLQQGILENEDFLSLWSHRADLEARYGAQLVLIEKDRSRSSRRLMNDDHFSTVKNAYHRLNDGFVLEGKHHLFLASEIKSTVIEPFSAWCEQHHERVDYSQSMVNDKIKQYKTSQDAVERIQRKYFNKCRLLEEFKAHFTAEEISDISHPTPPPLTPSPSPGPATTYTLGHNTFDDETLSLLLAEIMEKSRMKPHKVPILGTYPNCSLGSDITTSILEYFTSIKGSVPAAEEFGQDLVKCGFLRSVGSVANSGAFINSSRMQYQWRPQAFKVSGFVVGASENGPAGSITSPRALQIQDYLEEVKQAIGVNAIDYSDKSQLPRLEAESVQLDKLYFSNTVLLDKMRCALEELLMDHLLFMQKCESDRLAAIKKAMADFCACMGTTEDSQETQSYKLSDLLLVEETIDPAKDLNFLVKNYATGPFRPRVVLYDNYYDSHVRQTFGVDLSIKARLEGKVVPAMVQCILFHLDKLYPELGNDEERAKMWVLPVHLKKVHELRFQLNDLDSADEINAVLAQSHPLVITNALKLYLVELPDSVVPQSHYDVIKAIYVGYAGADPSKTLQRITGLQNVLLDIPRSNLATMDSIITHLNRLVLIIQGKDDEMASALRLKLAREFGALLLRQRPTENGAGSTNTHHVAIAAIEKHQEQFVNDLFEHKDEIFSELRRRSLARPRQNESAQPLRANLKQHGSASKSRLEQRLKTAVEKPRPLSLNDDPSVLATNLAASSLDPGMSSSAPSSPVKLHPLRRSKLAKKPLEALLLTANDDGDNENGNDGGPNTNSDDIKGPSLRRAPSSDSE